MDLQETARRFAAHAAVEDALFGVLGRWSVDETDHSAKVLFAEQAQHHGWHASLFRERTPAVGPVDDRSAEALVPVDRLGSCTGTVERLVGAQLVVVPAAVAAYERELAGLRWLSDGPAMHHALELVLADQRLDVARGASLARSLAGESGAAGVAADLRRRWSPGPTV